MLRTNLSTRPFYNQRAVRLVISAVALLAIGLTIFNVVELWRLQRQNREVAETLSANENQSRDLRQKAQAIRQSLNKDQLTVVGTAAREANALIDRRAFSWTELLNQFQTTLPADVRITAVTPQIDNDGRMLVAVTVVSRRIEDLETFMDSLEKTGAFTKVLSLQDTPEEDGLLRSVLQAYYGTPSTAGTAPSAVPPPPASESGKGDPSNRSASVATATAGGEAR